ncbi:MAG: tRNA (guanosine(46)-N7)-methyltransferase TrmB, partial [Alphaproteobacteria bacterium]|nr:tRNA (guanosine(46)-N7)-methyltransferase TrmB [Alphaproteobacteria bacterium]
RGRPLRAGRQRILADGLGRLGIDPATLPEGADPAALFVPRPRAVWLEIGFGAGEHLAWQAARHPDVGLIGAEPFLNGVARLLALAEAQGLANIRVLADDVRPLLDRLAPATLERVFVLFPDPWPKRRHRARRLVSAPLLDHLARTLADGGDLLLASDDAGYAAWMLRHLLAHPDFEWTARGPADWRRPADQPPTRYEEKNLAGGPGATWIAARRRPRRTA